MAKECRHCGEDPEGAIKRYVKSRVDGEILDLLGDETEQLRILFNAGILFVNPHYPARDEQDDGWLFVNCNDMFAWACSDLEPLPPEKISELFEMWWADPKWGEVKWCMWQRQQKPQPPVLEDMQKDGSWEDWCNELPDNWQEAEVKAAFNQLKKERFGESNEQD